MVNKNVKDRIEIVDCKNTKGVFYPKNNVSGKLSFINCEEVIGIEFDIAEKVFALDLSNLPNLVYLNIARTNIKWLDDTPEKCIVYCGSKVIINRVIY